MTSLPELLQQGSANAWLFIPSAILLGALHGLEPGHSKTMMAAFIVAVRGSVSQAVLLGLAATLSHTAIVWAVALVGLHYGSQLDMQELEPYFQLASAFLIIAIALWMLSRTYREQRSESGHGDHHHHHHDDEPKRIINGSNALVLEVFEEGVPPRFRLRFEAHALPTAMPPAASVSIATVRSTGEVQQFSFVAREGFLESLEEIPEPHAFTAKLSIRGGELTADYALNFEEHEHHHDHADHGVAALDYQDAHERAHASAIEKRFANRQVTTGQIILFGLTGGLIPCPAAITVLLLCLQLKKVTLGMTLVLSFSVGLALTMVFSGVLAALSVRHVSRRWSGFGTFARRAPYFSSAFIIVIGLYVGYHGWLGLHQPYPQPVAAQAAG